MNEELISALARIVANATPLIIASIGETITERAGIINLSLDGSIVLCAMVGFMAALVTDSLAAGMLAAMLVGAIIALIIAAASIELKQDQVAVGFVLTLLAADLAQFLGQDYSRIPGPQVPRWPIPVLNQLPIVGPVFFDHNVLVYISYALVLIAWFWLFRTRRGLAHRAVGERPEAAFARGTPVNRLRYIYTAVGGAMVGLAGAAYSLYFKPGWATPPAMRGDGWIALAIVIFGGWHPFRAVLGAYLFSALRGVSSDIQKNGLILLGRTIEVNFVLLNGLPWVLLIITLLMVSTGAIERLLRIAPRPVQRRMRAFLRSDSPRALGRRFDAD